MGVLRDITLALYATFQSCKSRGIHCRSLLGLLLDIDAGRYLEVSARKNVEIEITSYSQVGGRLSHDTPGCLISVILGSTSLR